ncbi:hypothetical protein BU26DRAFT_301464 [Trematosphaeria pertusa]|uniref:Uncharacterized protein n=1 Tax=Trematosphaeria pertusa TaxID=390896 RepID=A0A6A6IJ34_9PLEO|nr:uncharacterized protein BU26DRAFT_301464 [Trematosphaeria pertusa]KAF2250421.1 hypothetical protein BU26DRAFT_301464 [Trematosphaeria pertusa]
MFLPIVVMYWWKWHSKGPTVPAYAYPCVLAGSCAVVAGIALVPMSWKRAPLSGHLCPTTQKAAKWNQYSACKWLAASLRWPIFRAQAVSDKK